MNLQNYVFKKYILNYSADKCDLKQSLKAKI